MPDQKSSFVDFFIHHPVFSWVFNIIIVLLGLTAFYQLQTRQYPRTENTLVTVRTTMDGSSKIMENQVAVPLEDAFASLQGLDTMTTSIEKNEVTTKLSFANRSLDAASSDVRDVIERTKSRLPDECEIITSRGDIDAASVMDLVLTGENIPLADLYELAEKTIKSSLESIPGVATVEILGGSEFQMDLVLDPIKMSSYHVTASDVVNALKRQNFQRSAGMLKENDREFVLTTRAMLRTPQEFSDIVVSKHKERPIRLSDVGTANIQPAEEEIKVTYNGKTGVGLIVRPQSDGNPIQISQLVREKMKKIEKSFPNGAAMHVVVDRSLFIKSSIHQVYSAIFEATALVLAVILFFLRSGTAALIPLVTIPISLMGTFFIMYLLGFTINILSLLAVVLAIGLVVDDAIVVLENIYRYIEKGLSPLKAAVAGTREIRFSVIAMTLTLSAVYAPIAIMPGTIGQIFREFALTLAGAVLISGIVALTLSPLMCGRLLKAHTQNRSDSVGHPFLPFQDIQEKMEWLSQKIQNWLERLDVLYKNSITVVLSRKKWVLIGSAGLAAFSLLLAVYHLKKELSPSADEGLIIGKFYQSPSKNLQYLAKKAPRLDQVFKNQKEILSNFLVLQTQDSYAKAVLVPWNQRKPCRDIVEELRPKFRDVIGLDTSIRCVSSSIVDRGGSSQFPLSMELVTHRSADELQKIGRRLNRLLKKHPGVLMVDTTEIAQSPEYEITVNRERTHQLGIDPEEIAHTLQILIRGSKVGRFEKDDKMLPVHVWVGEKFRRSTEDISLLFVKGTSNRQEIMVPVREIISFTPKQTDPQIMHHMKKRAYTLAAALKPGYGLGEVYQQFCAQVEGQLPLGYELEPAGELQRFLKESVTTYIIFGLALVFIFLVMAAQFESFLSPFIILLSVPLALAGAILTLSVTQGTLNIYSQIGLITLIGLITKHGILLVDFANQEHAAGQTLSESILAACQMRLRPILMTTCAMVLGALPLAFAAGPGSEGRRQIGAVITGGMTLGTLFTLFVLPVVYVALLDLKKNRKRLFK